MRIFAQSIITLLLMVIFSATFAATCCTQNNCSKPCDVDLCCGRMGGISYCDSSAGRLVCNNGYYSSCYCTRHAVMDLQSVQGCCLWQGGVLSVDPTGLVICNSGGVSEICTLQTINQGSGW